MAKAEIKTPLNLDRLAKALARIKAAREGAELVSIRRKEKKK